MAWTGQVWGTELGKSLRGKLTSARQAENWLKYVSSFGYAIAFDDGRHVNIHLCCLSTLQTDPRKGCSDDQFSLLTRSPWDPVQLGTKKCLVMWLSFSSGGWGWEEYKPGETFGLESFKGLLLSHRKSFARTKGEAWSFYKQQNCRGQVHEADLAPWGNLSLTEDFGVNAFGGWRFPSPSPFSSVFIEEVVCCWCPGLLTGSSGVLHLVLILRRNKYRWCPLRQARTA